MTDYIAQVRSFGQDVPSMIAELIVDDGNFFTLVGMQFQRLQYNGANVNYTISTNDDGMHIIILIPNLYDNYRVFISPVKDRKATDTTFLDSVDIPDFTWLVNWNIDSGLNKGLFKL